MMSSLHQSFLRALNRLIAITIILWWLMPLEQSFATAAEMTPLEQAVDMLEQMTPEERVGQLFLITYQGSDVGEKSEIARIINDHHIGGIVMLAENDNFAYDGEPSETMTSKILADIQQLQTNAWNATQNPRVNTDTGDEYTPVYIPLLIGINQEGDGYPYDQILHGLTPLPNAMTMGATWQPNLAAEVGTVLGQELTALGFNLLLGPSLDVLESPQIEGANDLATRSFGGDPFWVAQMGKAFISGVHIGSNGQVAVVAKHFPGHGSSDRLPEEEVATVRKSLEELESFDLAPFYAVTGDASVPEETADALLVSHIRYQGLQGNIRATTRPVSFDPQAFSLLMQLPILNNWREDGGIMISDNLGSEAVRRFYALTSQDFEARRVTLNAFLAGNDLLYIADFSSENEPDPILALEQTLEFFSQKYREDTAFAQRVDESVLRILTLKFKLYPSFNLGRVLPSQSNIDELGTSSQVSFDVARQAATLISPSQAELDEIVPDPPNQNDRIVIINDTRYAQQCSSCPQYPLIDVNALSDAIIKLYGPSAGGQLTSFNLSSHTLEELSSFVNEVDDQNSVTMEIDLRRANWIVFNMLQNSNDQASFQTLRDFLAERPDLIQQKRLIVFTYSAPYYLDATNISKLTAYYSLYSKTPQSIDIAAYLLFQELRPIGAPPVSVAGVGYDLNEALFPDPDQVIPLELDLPQQEPLDTTPTLEPAPMPEYRVGDVIPLRTGIILDHNGNQVPDGTPVRFIFTTSGETDSVAIQTGTTFGGIARTSFLVINPGSLSILAESENARSSSLSLDIPTPSDMPMTPTATQTPTPTITPSPTITNEPTPIPAPLVTTEERPGPGDWLIAVLIASGIAWLAYRISILIGYVRWGVRAGFLALIGGLLTYTYVAMRLPGSEILMADSAARGVVLSSFGGAVMGIVLAFVWRAIASSEQHSSGDITG